MLFRSYAESFRDLAHTFTFLPEGAIANDTDEDVEDRQDYLMQKRLMENRGLLADHLNELAQIMTQVAEESFSYIRPSQKQLRELTGVLREQGILLKDLYIIENDSKHIQISTSLRAIKQMRFSVDEIAGLLSVVFDKRLLPMVGSILYLGTELQTIIFEEESKFGVLTGVARAIKETEKISGDNYSFLQLTNGKLLGSLSDGMGTGEKASRDSEEVIDLFEKLMEAGFSKETAIQIINGVLLAGSEQQNMSTLDVCDIDLYTGACELIKVGSAVTYIKRGILVEKIASTTLPLGVFGQIDMEPIRKRIMDGDYIIMVSDGVIDSLEVEGNAEIFQDMISKITAQNPKEIANNILNYAIHAGKGSIKDDMTVLVIGLWEKRG